MQLIALGGGRRQKDDTIDPSSGFKICKKTGDYVSRGEPLVEVYSTESRARSAVAHVLQNAFTIKRQHCKPKPLIRATLV
jgi:thymidine phosphorylase